jgi:hypothetical protein
LQESILETLITLYQKGLFLNNKQETVYNNLNKILLYETAREKQQKTGKNFCFQLQILSYNIFITHAKD